MNPLGSNGDRQTRLGREIDNAYEQAIARVDARSRAERTSAAASPGKGAAPDQTVFELRPAPNGEPHQLPLEDVLDSPFQPRKRPLGKKDVAELMGSLAAAGQVTPIVASPVPDQPGKYFVHSGHRRCAAPPRFTFSVRSCARRSR